MVKTKYVMALAGMRNSAGEAVCVTAKSRSCAIFSSKIDTGAGNASGVVLVYR